MRTPLWIVVLSACLSAQEITHATQPTVLSKVEPEYTDDARLVRLQGIVVLTAVVGADGVARNVTVPRVLGLGLDQKAIEAVGKWKFKPATKSGEPIDKRVVIEVVFRLPESETWYTRSALVRSGTSSADRLGIESVVAPHTREGEPKATATLSFALDASGKPIDIKVLSSTDDVWAHDVGDAVAQWQFSPPPDGRPLNNTIEFVRGDYKP